MTKRRPRFGGFENPTNQLETFSLSLVSLSWASTRLQACWKLLMVDLCEGSRASSPNTAPLKIPKGLRSSFCASESSQGAALSPRIISMVCTVYTYPCQSQLSGMQASTVPMCAVNKDQNRHGDHLHLYKLSLYHLYRVLAPLRCKVPQDTKKERARATV